MLRDVVDVTVGVAICSVDDLVVSSYVDYADTVNIVNVYVDVTRVGDYVDVFVLSL